MVSLPDGLESSDNRSEIRKLSESILDVMPGELNALIERINGSESEKISCLIADASMGWALEVADKMGIKKVAFWLCDLQYHSCPIVQPPMVIHTARTDLDFQDQEQMKADFWE
ncbi:UDP-glycosyltransferase 83A1 [Abeliophyllum distichum]|uniref:UDP-glycosyltransferase 83A1 n=1 Tax=Abeliophyllum distichum TaxID=126358 RepID=A0ABD1NVU1_9LAMI